MEHLNSLLDRYDRILVFDTETTGLRFTSDEIIQFSAVVVSRQNGTAAITDSYNSLISLPTGRTVPPEITRLTGITNEVLLEKGIDRSLACSQIAQLLAGNTLLAAYNAHFDLSFLFHMLRRYGDCTALAGKEKLDILTVYRDRRSYPHKLLNAIEAYQLGGVVQNSHSADDDALAAAWVLDAMAAERDDILCYIDLFGYSAKYGIGGKPIRSVKYVPQGFEPGTPLYEKAYC